MARTIYFGVTAFVLVAAGLSTACTGGLGEYKQYREQQMVASATPEFTPTFYKDPKRRHIAVFFIVVDGRLQVADRKAETRPGNLPYRSATAGNVVVTYRDAAGKELGRYATQDPVLVRSCDSENDKTGETTRLPDGIVVEILLPPDGRISSVDIGRSGDKPLTFSVSRQIASATSN